MNHNAWVWALLLFCLPSHAWAEIRLRDDRGATLVLASSPKRIVTLLPSLTESICALGACDRLVGTDRFSNAPKQVQALPKLGGLEDAQVERIVSLKPEIVLAAPSTRVIDRLESLGLKVLVIDAKTHADVKRSLELLGQLLEAPAAAGAAWAGIEAALADAAARMPPSVRGQRVYFEVDAAPYAAGATSFIGETLTRLGLRNAIPAELGPFPRINPEFVVKVQPDIIVAARRNLDDMPKRPGWSSLRALQRGQSCGFDVEHYELLIRPGPRLGEAAQLLAQCMTGLAVKR